MNLETIEVQPQDPLKVEYTREVIESLYIMYGRDTVEKELVKLIEKELEDEVESTQKR